MKNHQPSSETSVNFYRIFWRYIPEDNVLHRWKNLKSRKRHGLYVWNNVCITGHFLASWWTFWALLGQSTALGPFISAYKTSRRHISEHPNINTRRPTPPSLSNPLNCYRTKKMNLLLYHKNMKLSVWLNDQTIRHEDVWGSGGINLPILDLGTPCNHVQRHAPAALPPTKKPPVPIG
jgi:hypothetical protein